MYKQKKGALSTQGEQDEALLAPLAALQLLHGARKQREGPLPVCPPVSNRAFIPVTSRAMLSVSRRMYMKQVFKPIKLIMASGSGGGDARSVVPHHAVPHSGSQCFEGRLVVCGWALPGQESMQCRLNFPVCY